MIYTRRGCHLCDEAKEAIEARQQTYGYVVRTVDIEGDAALEESYGVHIPVILADGVEVARHRVSRRRWEHLLKKLMG